MTSEEDFQRHLDANPNDHHTRLVFADWLQERNDPRFNGYRALGKLGKYPKNYYRITPTDLHWYYSPEYDLIDGIERTAPHKILPKDWAELLPPEMRSAYRGAYRGIGRKNTEDAAAHAFNQLPPERQAELLGHHDPMLKSRNKNIQSKDKSLIVSYRRFSLKRLSESVNRYAKAEAGQITGQGIAPHLKGSRLGIVLREIRHTIGKSVPSIGNIADKLLGGHVSSKLFNNLRNALQLHGAEGNTPEHRRARQLANEYNWHRVADGIERDMHVRDYVNKAYEGHRLGGKGIHHRIFYNAVVNGESSLNKGAQISDEERLAHWKALHAHVKKATGKSFTNEELVDSLRRNGEAEHNLEQIAKAPRTVKGKPTIGYKPGHIYSVPDYDNEAWSTTEKGQIRAKPRSQLHPGQYERRRNLIRYGLRDRIVDKVNEELASPSMIPIENLTSHIGKKLRGVFTKPKDLNDLPTQHAAVHRALEESGLAPQRLEGESEDHYLKRKQIYVENLHKDIHDYLDSHPNDPMSRYHSEVVKNLPNPAWSPSSKKDWNATRTGPPDERLMHGYLPLVRYIHAQKGDERAPLNFLDNPHLDPMLRASGDVQSGEEPEELLDLNETTHHAHDDTHFDLSHHPLSIEGLGGIRPEEKNYSLPKLPSGFVELPHPDELSSKDGSSTEEFNPSDWSLEIPPDIPPKKPRNKPLPKNQRIQVYQTIAHALANKEDVHEALNREHGFDRPTATKHYNNFLKNKNRPQGKIRPENQIPRAKRGYSRDLMAIPKRYMRVGDPDTHDAIARGIVKNRDESGLGPFADFLDEQKAPGAALAREAHKNALDPKRVYPPFSRGEFWNGHDWSLPPIRWINEEGENSDTNDVPQGQIETSWELSRPRLNGSRGGLISITHGQQTSEPYPEHLLQYHVPVHSRKHLRELTRDLPHGMQNRLWREMAPHLPETHEPERLSRKPNKYASKSSYKNLPRISNGFHETPEEFLLSLSDEPLSDEDYEPNESDEEPSEDSTEEPIKKSADRAPAGGITVRGTQYKGGNLIPSMTSSFMNPRRKMFSKSKKDLAKILHGLKGKLAEAAQKVYDSWDADSDPEHGDPECGHGGICHEIADEMAGVLSSHGIDSGILNSNGVGEQHVWAYAHNGKDLYHVDIHPHHYETGGGYTWKKKPGVVFTPDHVSIDKGSMEDANEDY